MKVSTMVGAVIGPVAVLWLAGCGGSVRLDEPFSVSNDSNRSVDGTGLVLDDCVAGEDFTEDGGELWVELSGTVDGDRFSRTVYEDSASIDRYIVEILSVDRDGGCELRVTEPDS